MSPGGSLRKQEKHELHHDDLVTSWNERTAVPLAGERLGAGVHAQSGRQGAPASTERPPLSSRSRRASQVAQEWSRAESERRASGFSPPLWQPPFFLP